MIEAFTLASGSSGNALLVRSGSTAVLMDAGRSRRAILRALAEAGIRAALISNNHADRVERFNAVLGLPTFPDAHKPLPRTARAALAAIGAEPARAASLGDQIFTDVACARFCGMQAILVPPIRDKRTLFWRIKRALERPIIAAWRRRNGEFTQV